MSCNWLFKISQTRYDIFDLEYFRQPLYQYVQRNFLEYNKDQSLLFGLSQEDLMKSLVDMVLHIPFYIDYTDDPREQPSGVFTPSSWSIQINGINKKKYLSDRYRAGYSSYVDSVVYHELVHALNFVKKLWDKVSYDHFSLGKDYYGDPEEIRAYNAQMRDFLSDFIQIKPHQVRRLMNTYTNDRDPDRKNWISYIQNRKS